MAENKPNRFASLWRAEDWWSLWIGAIIIILGITGAVTKVYKPGTWTEGAAAFAPEKLGFYAIVGVAILALTSLAILGKRESLPRYLMAFPVVFVMAFFAQLIGKFGPIAEWGVGYALWALLIGLLISNTIGTPKWLKPAVQPELFIKIGLVLMGARILFFQMVAAGPLALLQTILSISAVWFLCYFLATRVGLTKSFAAVLSSAVSICGVSAAMAAGGAAKGNPKEVSYTVSLVLIVAVPLLVLMPVIARLTGIPDVIAGAWIGGVIDTTPAVAAAGAMHGEAAMDMAVIVKMVQNVFIGVAALLIALYFTLRGRSDQLAETSEHEKLGLMEIWYRFPKFILGFIIASLVFSLILTPTLGQEATSSLVKNVTEAGRSWFFTLAFITIGLQTRIWDILSMDRGKPFFVFLAAQIFNIFWTLGVAYLVFGVIGKGSL
jgi:uncharacterized membrane protein YadS